MTLSEPPNIGYLTSDGKEANEKARRSVPYPCDCRVSVNNQANLSSRRHGHRSIQPWLKNRGINCSNDDALLSSSCSIVVRTALLRVMIHTVAGIEPATYYHRTLATLALDCISALSCSTAASSTTTIGPSLLPSGSARMRAAKAHRRPKAASSSF